MLNAISEKHVRLSFLIDLAKRSCNQTISGKKYKILILHSLKGVQGLSIVTLHKPFNPAKGLVVDSMHNIYLGVVITLFQLRFSTGT